MSTTRFHRPGSPLDWDHKEDYKYCCVKCREKLPISPRIDEKRLGLCKCGWENRWFGKRGFAPGEYSKGNTKLKHKNHKKKRLAKKLKRMSVNELDQLLTN